MADDGLIVDQGHSPYLTSPFNRDIFQYMEKDEKILAQVRDTIEEHGMIAQGDGIVVGVSGGPDSVCLLDILNRLSGELGIRLVTAHFNHGLRGPEDDAETELVVNMAGSMGLPYKTGKAFHLQAGTSSLEEKARLARYRFLETVREHFNARKIALGHNLNDQAETVIMRLLRGSGLSGLAGIPPVRGGIIIRPLIRIKREDIISYLRARNLTYAIDGSNRNLKFTRNRIRFKLLPMMLEYQPKLIENLGRLSAILRDEEDFMESLAWDWVQRESAKEDDGSISVALSSFSMLHAALRNRVIRYLLKKTGSNLRHVNNNHIRSVSDIIDKGNPQSMINLPNGIIVRRVYDRLMFTVAGKPLSTDFQYRIESPGQLHMRKIGKILLVTESIGKTDPIRGDSGNTALLDADTLHYPLVVRNFKAGDRFVPLGMKGHKKVKDFFIDLKVPSPVRAVTPILTCDDFIVWICGYRIDERFKVTSKTKKVLRISIS